MQAIGLSILLACVIFCFAGIILWALLTQSRNEKALAVLPPGELRASSGFESLLNHGFALYQVVPTPNLTVVEYRIQDEQGHEIGRYIGTGKKSAILKCGSRSANLYIQGAAFGRTVYAGTVGGKSSTSIVIRDENRVLAEAERTRIFPASSYRLICEGAMFEITSGGLLPNRPGTIAKDGKQVAAFRRPTISSRNIVVAFHSTLSDELKVFLCGITLLG